MTKRKFAVPKSKPFKERFRGFTIMIWRIEKFNYQYKIKDKSGRYWYDGGWNKPLSRTNKGFILKTGPEAYREAKKAIRILKNIKR